MAIMQLFKNHILSCKHIFTNGKEANFINGEYLTDIQSEIDDLKYQISHGHPHIYIDSENQTVDTLSNPLEEIKRKAVEEYLASLETQAAEIKAGTQDLGESPKSEKLQGILASNKIIAAASN